eukprot:COSAG06_NODE_833_length_12029_cov_38.339868_6_plen_98_part_00
MHDLDGTNKENFSNWDQYCLSKAACVLFTQVRECLPGCLAGNLAGFSLSPSLLLRETDSRIAAILILTLILVVLVLTTSTSILLLSSHSPNRLRLFA